MNYIQQRFIQAKTISGPNNWSHEEKGYYNYGLVLYVQIWWGVNGSLISLLWSCKRPTVAHLVFVWGALGNAEDNSRSFGLLDRFLWLKSKFIDLEDYSVVFNVMYMEREREREREQNTRTFERRESLVSQFKFIFLWSLYTWGYAARSTASSDFFSFSW